MNLTSEFRQSEFYRNTRMEEAETHRRARELMKETRRNGHVHNRTHTQTSA